MKRKPKKQDKTVSKLSNHPKHVLKRVRRAVENANNIQWSFDINDLELARKVQIRTILKCLSTGELQQGSLTSGGDNVSGVMVALIGGMTVSVNFFLGPADSGLIVVDVDAEEEE